MAIQGPVWMRGRHAGRCAEAVRVVHACMLVAQCTGFLWLLDLLGVIAVNCCAW